MKNISSKEESVILAQAQDLMDAGQSLPPDLEERCIRIHLRTYPDRADLLQRLCAVLAGQGKAVPLDLEERAILSLPELSERNDLQARLRIVQVALGKAPPPDPVIGASGEQASQTDIDFQAEADKYDAASKYGDLEPEFLAILEQCRRYTMTSVERMYAVYQSVKYIEKSGTPGALVECGVWRGGSIMVALLTLAKYGATSRDIYLFDTFEGLPRPDAHEDVDIFGNRAIDGWIPHARGDERSNWAYASIEDVRRNMALTGYPLNHIHYVQGMVENTIPENAPDRIAILRLDTDWYSSTRHEMEHLYPRLSNGGVLIIDDYGHFLGSRKAVDDYVRNNDLSIMLTRLDYSGRMGIKSNHSNI